jgi:hypothetical protein
MSVAPPTFDRPDHAPDRRSAGPAGLRMPAIPRSWREALWVTLIVRFGLLLLGVFVWVQLAPPEPCHFEVARNGWATIPPLDANGASFPLVGVWQRWDACWYSKIAAFGYESGTDATAFFPAFPMLMRVASWPLGGDVALGGLLVNLVLTVVGLAGLHRLVTRDLGVRIADRTILYLSIFPAAIFLYAPFTEALFLACTAWAFVGARERQWWLAAGAALIAGLTRTQGLLLALPIAWEAFVAWRAAGGPSARDHGRALPSIAAVVAPFVGFGIFVWFTSAVVGESSVNAQDAWGGLSFHWPWETVTAAIDWVVNGLQNPGVELLNVATFLLMTGIVIAAVRLLPLSYTLYAVTSLLFIIVRLQPTPMTSTTRYLLVIFPAFVALGIVGRHRRFDMAWTLVSTLFLGVVAVTFLRGDFVA